MSQDIKDWLHTYSTQVKATFGKRIQFIGLQGSYATGEATPDSDIDVVLVLDTLDANDLRAYRQAISQLPHRDKICGFISGRTELSHWDRCNLFNFAYDTVPIYGNLDFLPEINVAQARQSILAGICNIYHTCCHNFLHERSCAMLQGLRKTVFFVLRAQYYCQTGRFITGQKNLLTLLEEEERALLQADKQDLEALSEKMLTWSSAMISRYSQQQEEDV